jgi:hypothetical protein
MNQVDKLQDVLNMKSQESEELEVIKNEVSLKLNDVRFFISIVSNKK